MGQLESTLERKRERERERDVFWFWFWFWLCRHKPKHIGVALSRFTILLFKYYGVPITCR